MGLEVGGVLDCDVSCEGGRALAKGQGKEIGKMSFSLCIAVCVQLLLPLLCQSGAVPDGRCVCGGAGLLPPVLLLCFVMPLTCICRVDF